MITKKLTNEWIEASTTARKIINSHTAECAKNIQREPCNCTWIYDNVRDSIAKILTDLENAEKISIIPTHELAEIQIDLIQKQKVDKSDWNSVKNFEIQKVRKKYLEEIIKKKAKKIENLLPVEIFALEDKLFGGYVDNEDQCDSFKEFIDHRIQKIIDELQIVMFRHDDNSKLAKQNYLQELQLLWSEREIMYSEEEDEILELVAEKWKT